MITSKAGPNSGTGAFRKITHVTEEGPKAQDTATPEQLQEFDLVLKRAREKRGERCRIRQLLVGQASIDGCIENPCWPNPAPKGWVPPFWRNRREEADWGFADEHVQGVRDERRKRAAESLERHLKARREEQLDKWIEVDAAEVDEEIEDGSQQILERASQVSGGQRGVAQQD